MAAVPQLQAVLVWRRVEKKRKGGRQSGLGREARLARGKVEDQDKRSTKRVWDSEEASGGKIATRRKMSKMSCQ